MPMKMPAELPSNQVKQISRAQPFSPSGPG